MIKILVPPEGPLSAKIAFIGEAPGEVEERYGRPFMPNAPAGGLFDELLRTAGINRIDCYITNVIKERPPNNDIKKFIDTTRATPIISPIGQEYIEKLYKELDKVNANVFVPLGNVAMFVLTGNKDILKRRGSVLY
ncbi:hypothetical protein LCGC14_2844290, partial [marine sediment metagenome]